MGTQNGHNVPLLESASPEKRKSVIKQFITLTFKVALPLNLGYLEFGQKSEKGLILAICPGWDSPAVLS